MLLEEQGIELIDESEAEEREGGTPAKRSATSRPSCASSTELVIAMDEDGDGQRIDDPVRMYLTQMGEIPLLDPRGGNRARQEDRGHPQALPPQGARMRLRPAQRRRDAQARPHRRPALRPHHQGLADREPGEGQDPPAHAAQPARRSNTLHGAERRGLPPGCIDERLAEEERDAIRAQPPASAAARPSRWSRSCRSARRRSSR